MPTTTKRTTTSSSTTHRSVFQMNELTSITEKTSNENGELEDAENDIRNDDDVSSSRRLKAKSIFSFIISILLVIVTCKN